MNDANSKIKQQIVEKIKSSTNILLTVSRNPSVDDLSAAIGLAALLNKLDKHATAIFSGDIPPAITFLDPTKVFENNVDSLRDFIIALDKEKADHLRYKVEGDLVRIFITPYRTTITNEDLEFSHGDFNVDLVMALGVLNKEDLDTAIEAHGNILQNVTIVTLGTGTQISPLGTLDWHDETASSLSEMITGIGEAIKSDKPLLDQQIATALLTGIVYATDRFSNAKTSSRVMTVAAQLMAAGADQQLIAAKLQESHEINSLKYSPIISKGGEPIVNNPAPKVAETKTADGALSVQHEVSSSIGIEPNVKPTGNFGSTINTASPAVKPAVSLPSLSHIEPVASTPPPIIIEEKPKEVIAASAAKPESTLPPISEPSLGGTLSATSEQAADDARREIEDQQNKVILQHAYVGGTSSQEGSSPINSTGQDKEVDSIDIFADSPMIDDAPKMDVSTLAQKAATINPPSETVNSQPIAPTPIIDLPMPPPLPDFSTLPPVNMESSFSADVPHQASPDLSTLPPQPATNDLSQFKIPGQ